MENLWCRRKNKNQQKSKQEQQISCQPIFGMPQRVSRSPWRVDKITSVQNAKLASIHAELLEPLSKAVCQTLLAFDKSSQVKWFISETPVKEYQ